MSDMYAAVRAASAGEEAETCALFRRMRNVLFSSHPDSPLSTGARAAFRGLAYYPYDPRWRVHGVVDDAVAADGHGITVGGDGPVPFVRVALVRFECPAGSASLSLYWIEGYGGGLFLPFRDGTSGNETYHAGRYLIDTAKGADLGLDHAEILLDFNYAYHPSCAYSDQWACPLAPRENWLPFAVPVGERMS